MSDLPDSHSPLDDATRTQDPSDANLPLAFGPYRLLQKVGEGGMGEVWGAEQTKPVRRQVAIKLIKVGMDTTRVVARFAAERQALALMNHPAIAKVFDAGATDNGRPYFAMEFVRGESITAYCNRHRLTTRDRIDLFLQVCEGVEHAHQKGIIHRDLKPSNMLVTMLDNRPLAKIIDFGVAKAMAQPLTEHALLTEYGALIGTPEYMSPEQAEMTGLDIDTRTDVYALGVVLYELLTGALPFESAVLRQKGLDEIRRTIREVEPLTPSACATLAATAQPPASKRPDIRAVANQLRGDLDWITMKALEKDRTRRYGSAAELAADLRRHLNHVPVIAGPPSTRYRLSKFVRRHRTGVAVAATLALLLIAFAATTFVQAQRIARERDRANVEAETARAVNEFLLNDLLAQASAREQARPDIKPDPNLTVRTAVDRAAARIANKFAGQPLVEASIRHTIGTTYRELGAFAESERQLERALQLRRSSLGDGHLDTARAANDLALTYRRLGKLPEAEALLNDALSPGASAADERAAFDLMDNLAGVYREQGKLGDAESLLVKALDGKRRVAGPDHSDTLSTQNNLALVYLNSGKFAQAEPLLTEALATRRRVSGSEHPETLTVINNLATVYFRLGAYDRAQPLMAEVLDIRRRVLGEEHPSTLLSMNNLAFVYRATHQYANAEELFARTLAARERVLGNEHPDTITTRNNLALVHDLRGNSDSAEFLLHQVVESRRRLLGAQHPDTAASMVALGRIRLKASDYVAAQRWFEQALAGYDKTGVDRWERFNTRSLLGATIAGQAKYAEAEPLLLSAYDGLVEREAAIPKLNRSDIDEAGQRIVTVYESWGQPAKATEWRMKLSK